MLSRLLIFVYLAARLSVSALVCHQSMGRQADNGFRAGEALVKYCWAGDRQWGDFARSARGLHDGKEISWACKRTHLVRGVQF